MIVSSNDFVVAEQCSSRGYVMHVFANKAQFKNWRIRNPLLKVLDRTCARGRIYESIDHRFDFTLSSSQEA